MEEREPYDDGVPSQPPVRYTVYSISTTVVISFALTLIAVYLMGYYTLALFVVIPLLIGAVPILIYNRWYQVTPKRSYLLSFGSFFVYGLTILLFAVDGLICLLAATPLALPVVFIGALLARFALRRSRRTVDTVLVVLLASFPVVAWVEPHNSLQPRAVTSEIIIDAPRQDVWDNVVSFPELPPPDDYLFTLGISYPIRAKINGTGVGAVRYCEFNTGAFIEPITTWNEPSLLQFDVAQQPVPLTELSIWNVHAPHLDGYFNSVRGEFRLIELSSNRTLLKGTTWYSQDFTPAWYWHLWSDHIIHMIHARVLEHIKVTSEAK